MSGRRFEESISRCGREHSKTALAHPRLLLRGALVFLGTLLLLFHSGCQTNSPPQRVGGPCEYRDISGSCRIESIEPAGANAYGEGFHTLFTFVPESATEESSVRGSLRIGDGQDPTRRYLEANRIEVGREYPCVRKLLIRGTCSPQVFVFPEFRPEY
jgi:hypothetical protein